jgi:2,3-bisphosphoglycerate-dependent phosphoglycerate mutase
MTDRDRQPRLVLIKHSVPEMQIQVESRFWRLSEEGRKRCAPLAEKLRRFNLTRIVSSNEPKAVETAELVASELSRTHIVRPDLQENDRTGLGFVGLEAYQDTFRRFFAEPDRVVVGTETAEESRARFSAAVEGVLEEFPDETLAIVTHGAVISLLVSEPTPEDRFRLWRRLGLPSYVVVSRPSLEIVEEFYGLD